MRTSTGTSSSKWIRAISVRPKWTISLQTHRKPVAFSDGSPRSRSRILFELWWMPIWPMSNRSCAEEKRRFGPTSIHRGGTADGSSRQAHRRDGRCWLSRKLPRRQASGQGLPQHLRAHAWGLRPHPLGFYRRALSGTQARRLISLGRCGRRDWRKSLQPRPVLLRECHHGYPADRSGSQLQNREDDHSRNHLRLPEIHADSVSRGRAVGRLSGGNKRGLRSREENAVGAVTGVPSTVRDEFDLPSAGKPLRSA